MSFDPSNITDDDHIRWIVNTSIQDGINSLQSLLRQPDIPPQRLARILESAIAMEIRGAHRKTLLSALKSALAKALAAVPSDLQPVEVLAPAAPPADSAALITLINANHATAQQDADRARALGESAVRHAILAGLQLIQLKELTPHGGWEALFSSAAKRIGKANATHVSHLDFDSQTARRYIAVATQLVTRKLQPEQSAALMALASGTPPDDSAAALLDELTPPKSLRQTYLELGIVKPTPKEALWLTADPSDPSDPSGPPEPAKPSPVSKLRTAREAARRDWFGEAKPGHMTPGSPAGLMELELNDPARGTLRLLCKADLETLADGFRRLAKLATEYAKEK